jgi:hypothetical protein
MTEAEWLECDDWALMQPHFGARATVRVLRLFACACCRTISHLFTEPQLIESVEVAERFADGSASDDELRSASDFAGAVSQSIKYAQRDGSFPNEYPSSAVQFATDSLEHWDMEHAAGVAYADAEWAVITDNGAPREWIRTKLGALIHDLFGNPFRPVHFHPAWRTDTARTLARQMYESRECGAAPILADALQDAGCDADDLLNHLRDPHAAHVRGCWALDLVLGKA